MTARLLVIGGSLPLGLKIALVGVLWLGAWSLIFSGMDRAEGFAVGGRRSGWLRLIGGAALGLCGVVLWL